MNIFVAAFIKNTELTPVYEQLLPGISAVTVPFLKENHERVIFKDKNIIAASFSIHASHCPIKRYTEHQGNSFCTFNGIPLFQNNHAESWANALLGGLRNGTLLPENIGGYYNLLYINEGKIEAFNCLTRVEPVYFLENRYCIVVGNRASLVWGLGNRSINFDYDEDALLTFATAGWLVNDLTPYKGVKLLPNGHKIAISASDFRISPYKPYYFYETNDESYLEGLIDPIQEELVSGIKLFSKFKDKISVNLSGGKDSRILAAACHKAGIRYSCITSGGELFPDMVVAKEVVQLLDCPEHITSARDSNNIAPEIDIFKKVDHHIQVGEGMLSINDPTYEIRQKPAFLLSGHGGELLRGGYDRSLDRPRVGNLEAAKKFLKDLTLHNASLFLKEEAIQSQLAYNESIMEKFLNSGFPFINFYDWMYTVYRETRGIGSIRQGSSFGAFSFSPFLNDNLLKLAWHFPLEFRKEEHLYFQLLKNINPQLAYHRFADSRWKFEMHAPSSGQSMQEWEKRAPLPPGPVNHSAHNWRSGYDGYLRTVIRDYLLQNANNSMFKLVDYGKLEKILNAEPPTNNSVIKSILGLFTAVYLTNNTWIKVDS